MAVVRRRARLFERIAPYKRSGNQQRRRSAYLRTQHARLLRELRADLLRALPELSTAPEDAIEAFDLVTSFETWDRLRADQRLSRERAEATLLHLLQALVNALPALRARR